MIANCAASENFEISPRFRRTVEQRIARLERDATHDGPGGSAEGWGSYSPAYATGGNSTGGGAADAAVPLPRKNAVAATAALHCRLAVWKGPQPHGLRLWPFLML